MDGRCQRPEILAGEPCDERADGEAVAVGEEGVVGGGDEVASWAFRGNGADDLFKPDLDFSLDYLFEDEGGSFANAQLHIFGGISRTLTE